MKSLFHPALVLLFCLFTACSQPTESTQPPENLVVSVSGMTCESCVNAITSAVQQLPGVDTCTVSLEEASATVVYRPGTLTPEQIQKRINQLGFQAALPETDTSL